MLLLQSGNASPTFTTRIEPMPSNLEKGRQDWMLENLERIQNDFAMALNICEDSKTQAQIIALRAHAETISIQMQMLRMEIASIGLELRHSKK